MTSPHLTRSDLIALARKYRLLAELRRERELWSASELNAPLARLASEFPGVLRELDSLSLAELELRLEALEQALRSGSVARWMIWIHAYHRSMRAALEVRARLGGRLPGGGLHVVVIRCLERELGAPASSIGRELFAERGLTGTFTARL